MQLYNPQDVKGEVVRNSVEMLPNMRVSWPNTSLNAKFLWTHPRRMSRETTFPEIDAFKRLSTAGGGTSLTMQKLSNYYCAPAFTPSNLPSGASPAIALSRLVCTFYSNKPPPALTTSMHAAPDALALSTDSSSAGKPRLQPRAHTAPRIRGWACACGMQCEAQRVPALSRRDSARARDVAGARTETLLAKQGERGRRPSPRPLLPRSLKAALNPNVLFPHTNMTASPFSTPTSGHKWLKSEFVTWTPRMASHHRIATAVARWSPQCRPRRRPLPATHRQTPRFSLGHLMWHPTVLFPPAAPESSYRRRPRCHQLPTTHSQTPRFSLGCLAWHPAIAFPPLHLSCLTDIAHDAINFRPYMAKDRVFHSDTFYRISLSYSHRLTRVISSPLCMTPSSFDYVCQSLMPARAPTSVLVSHSSIQARELGAGRSRQGLAGSIGCEVEKAAARAEVAAGSCVEMDAAVKGSARVELAVGARTGHRCKWTRGQKGAGRSGRGPTGRIGCEVEKAAARVEMVVPGRAEMAAMLKGLGYR
ncbi:hypothetical protein FB451DRAFT_1517179 [Mycena latifolia]|nr:hypothetical protein FB451DRAFT_1517179 [Mycena latifolia]